jgi:hypothetical protein
VSAARVVLSGELWRVLALELPNQHGVLETEYIIEMTEPKDKDRLGTQRWHELDGGKNTSYTDWMRAARYFLDELLKAAGEEPNAPHRQRVSK